MKIFANLRIKNIVRFLFKVKAYNESASDWTFNCYSYYIILSREMPLLRTSFSVAVTFENSIKNSFHNSSYKCIHGCTSHTSQFICAVFRLHDRLYHEFNRIYYSSVTIVPPSVRVFPTKSKSRRSRLIAAMIASPFQSSLTTSVKSCTLRFHSFCSAY